MVPNWERWERLWSAKQQTIRGKFFGLAVLMTLCTQVVCFAEHASRDAPMEVEEECAYCVCVEVGRVGWGGGVWGHVRVWIAMVMCQKEKRGFDHCGAAMINEDVAALGKQHEAIGIDPVSSKGT